jgi:glycosyltransferase involved in cell wall biosynthesis
MKILHVNKSIRGGAGIASYRLHEGLIAQGMDSKMMIGSLTAEDSKAYSDSIIKVPPPSKLEQKILLRISTFSGLNDLCLFNSFQIPNNSFFQTADIINFHNLQDSYFNYLSIPILTKKKPTIFTLHDMWSFTGHCSYSYDCDRWQIGCGKCPHLDVYPAINRDNTRIEWNLKKWIYKHSNLTVVTPSQWLTKKARESLLSHLPIYHIPNGIDTKVYQPIDSECCRSILGISSEKQVLMFGAHDLKDVRKGSDLMLKALKSLPEKLKSNCLLLTFGIGGENLSEIVGITNLNLGYLTSDRLKAIAFSAADIFLFPTRADNLPVVLQESMACGTPMISFKVGGVPDLVRPGVTGYLANSENIDDFRNGIIELLENQCLRNQLAENCRRVAVSEYSLELQVKRYMQLYDQVLHSK